MIKERTKEAITVTINKEKQMVETLNSINKKTGREHKTRDQYKNTECPEKVLPTLNKANTAKISVTTSYSMLLKRKEFSILGL